MVNIKTHYENDLNDDKDSTEDNINSVINEPKKL